MCRPAAPSARKGLQACPLYLIITHTLLPEYFLAELFSDTFLAGRFISWIFFVTLPTYNLIIIVFSFFVSLHFLQTRCLLQPSPLYLIIHTILPEIFFTTTTYISYIAKVFIVGRYTYFLWAGQLWG